jgi:hypothetical protein
MMPRRGAGSIAILIQFRLAEAGYLSARAILGRLPLNLGWDISRVLWGPIEKIRLVPNDAKAWCGLYCNTGTVQAGRGRIPQCKSNLGQTALKLEMGHPKGVMRFHGKDQISAKQY